MLVEAQENARAASNPNLAWRELESYSQALRTQLEKRGRIAAKRELGKESLTQYCITDAGLAALQERREAKERPRRSPGRKPKATPTVTSRNYSPAPLPPLRSQRIIPFQGVATSEPELLVNHDGCTNCVYRQAVEILAVRFPQVNQLLEALKSVEEMSN